MREKRSIGERCTRPDSGVFLRTFLQSIVANLKHLLHRHLTTETSVRTLNSFGQPLCQLVSSIE